MANRRGQEDAAAAAAAMPSFFYVKHHNEEVALLNSKVPTSILQDRLRKLAGAVDLSLPEMNVDLVLAPGGSSSGGAQDQKSSKNAAEPLILSDRLGDPNGPPIYANSYIASRTTYVLLSVFEDEDGIRNFKPIWKSAVGDESDRLASQLDNRAAEERKKLGTKKGVKK